MHNFLPVVAWVSLLPCILALSSSSSSSSSSASSTSTAAARQLANNWFSIATHLQNPTLYSAEWANACQYHPEHQTLVTSRVVHKGEILSLVPIHAIGLKGMGGRQTTTKTDWMVFDADQDSEYFQQQSNQQSPKASSSAKQGFGKPATKAVPPKESPFRYEIPTMATTGEQQQPSHSQHHHVPPQTMQKALFCDVNPLRPLRTGWLGHLAQRTPLSPLSDGAGANCHVVPIAMPLCALVATQQLQPDTPLLRLDEAEMTIPLLRVLLEEQEQFFIEHYRQEIQELQQYIDMAYPKQPQYQEQIRNEEEEESPLTTNTPTETSDKSAAAVVFTHPFYDFPRGDDGYTPYPLQVLRTDPDILVVPNFLSDSECDRLIQKARPHLVACVTKNPRTGVVEEDASRTSRNANIPQVEVPSIVDKLTELTNCTKEQLEMLQVLHYAPGQYFEPHTDGFAGPISACGFDDSARLVTIFCYLNAVEKGGATRFGDLDLEIAPQKGMAAIHFPTTMGFEDDERTEHEGMVAADEKWLLVTWVWMHPRDQNSIFAEKWLNPLDDERI